MEYKLISFVLLLFRRTGESGSFAVGHLAAGYLVGKASAKLVKTEINVPIIFVLSIIPDVDFLVPFLQHRGPTHSVIVATIVFIPIFAFFRGKAFPYFLALIQHPLVTDYVSGSRVQLFWPLSAGYYGIETGIKSQTSVALELILFLVSMVIMLQSRDLASFFKAHRSNLILSIPTFTVLLPTFLKFPLDVPIWLIPPHLIYAFVFLASLFVGALALLKSV
jgi:membrane-bound metal-dependent hydrolase YbcI (DUF457 family)